MKLNSTCGNTLQHLLVSDYWTHYRILCGNGLTWVQCVCRMRHSEGEDAAGQNVTLVVCEAAAQRRCCSQTIFHCDPERDLRVTLPSGWAEYDTNLWLWTYKTIIYGKSFTNSTLNKKHKKTQQYWTLTAAADSNHYNHKLWCNMKRLRYQNEAVTCYCFIWLADNTQYSTCDTDGWLASIIEHSSPKQRCDSDVT